MISRQPSRARSRGAPPEPGVVPDRPRILAFVYGLAPGEGSELGAGWVWARLLASIGRTWVITRPLAGDHETVETVERALADLPADERPEVVWVDLPRWTSVWRRGETSRLQRFEYLLWQISALRIARRLDRRHPFDLVWHLIWANAWLGTTASLVGRPFVYGPVGGGVGPPWRLVPTLGGRGIGAELLRGASRFLARHLNPLARISWRRASLVLVQNPETRDWLPQSTRSKTVIFPNAVIEGELPVAAGRRDHPPTALFAGRLIPWKGGALAVRAIAQCPGWRLIVCGDGPETGRLRLLSARLGILDRVDLRGWQVRDEVLRILREETDVFLFPSLHDEGSWAVAEAISAGVPVVCLNRGGPRALGGVPVAATWPRETVTALAEATRSALGDTRPPAQQFDFSSARQRLTALLLDRKLVPESVEARGS